MECGCGMGFFEFVICGELVMCGELVICGGPWRVELTLPCRGCFFMGLPGSR